jgi:hypothetical protein
MKKIALVFICTFLVGCASDPAKRKLVAIEESSRMQPTAEPLSSFDNFKLADMTLAPSVQTEPEKVVVAKSLDVKLKTKLDPLISNWNAKAGYVQGGRTVEIQPRVVSLRVISGTTRFFAGAWAGQSDISMELILVDKETGEEIGRTRIQRAAGAFAGAWSFGMTDKSLPDYVVDIAYQYLVDNYKEAE